MHLVTVLDPEDLIAWRKKHDLTLREAASLFSVSETQYWKLEKGAARIPNHFHAVLSEVERDLAAQAEVKAMVRADEAVARKERQAAADARFVKENAAARRRDAGEERSQRLADLRRQIAEVEDKAIDGLDVKAFLSAMG